MSARIHPQSTRTPRHRAADRAAGDGLGLTVGALLVVAVLLFAGLRLLMSGALAVIQ